MIYLTSVEILVIKIFVCMFGLFLGLLCQLKQHGSQKLVCLISEHGNAITVELNKFFFVNNNVIVFVYDN